MLRVNSLRESLVKCKKFMDCAKQQNLSGVPERFLLWLGDRDSNPDRQSQSLQSCHWTISQLNIVFSLAMPEVVVKAS